MQRHDVSTVVLPKPRFDLKGTVPRSNWVPWIFAAKTTASGLIALLVAFTFNLDQPYWALLTVFIVSQPQQSGQVLAKSFYRVIGTVIGAAMALILIGLCAQERVLFLGALALWIGLCAFGSQYARNWAAYSFVLSGYTVAIVGIPAALDAGNAFYIATGRVTEISLGIIVAATVSHVVVPTSLVPSLWRAVAGAQAGLADYAVALFGAGDTATLRTKLLGLAIEIENLRASAIFEDRQIRARSNAMRLLDLALINAVGTAQLLRRALDALGGTGPLAEAGLGDAIAKATVSIKAWRAASLDASGLERGLVRARACLPLVRQLCRDQSAPDEEVIGRIAVIARLREFFTALTAYAEAYEAVVSGAKPEPRRIGFAHSNDLAGALWTGLRAALAVFLVSSFWILTNWAHGSTAAVLGAVATARLATMAPAVPIAVGATLIFALATIPAFITVEVLLPLADGFGMFALAVAPMLFLCAFLIAHKKTMLIGYLSALLFASAGGFVDRMVYDPVGFINTSIAAVVAAATAMVLWAIIAPATPEAARGRFVRAARRALPRIAARHWRIRLAEFETAMTEALGQLRNQLRSDQPDDIAVYEAAIALFDAGRDLIRVRDDRASSTTAALELDIAELAGNQPTQWLDRARRTAEEAAAKCLAELRDDEVAAAQAGSATRKVVAFAAIRDELERGGPLLTGGRLEGAHSDAA
ncbi:MAG TPA: FUSC family protein [Stellaceae bacterium]|nr:FUSC family protein [Stellaceae bacterium]